MGENRRAGEGAMPEAPKPSSEQQSKVVLVEIGLFDSANGETRALRLSNVPVAFEIPDTLKPKSKLLPNKPAALYGRIALGASQISATEHFSC